MINPRKYVFKMVIGVPIALHKNKIIYEKGRGTKHKLISKCAVITN